MRLNYHDMILQLNLSPKIRFVTLLVFLLSCSVQIGAHDLLKMKKIAKNEILFISSYNSDTKYTSDNINSFIETYSKLGGKHSVVVENMNAMSLKEAHQWQNRIKAILQKHPNVQLIILLGGEAWISYMQMAEEKYKKIPVMCAMASRYGVRIPADSVNLSSYEPEGIDMLKVMEKHNVRLALSYDYDVSKEIELMKSFYPKMKNLVLLTDNTYNGISHYTLLRKELKKHPDINPIFIDGRKLTLDKATAKLHDVPKGTVMLVGIWKIDSLEISYINNSVYAFKFANPTIPVFSLTSTGIGYWAIGGYVPVYDGVGRSLGLKAYEILDLKRKGKPLLSSLRNEYKLDAQKMKELNLDIKKAPKNAIYINDIPPFLSLYKKEIETLFLVFITLIIGLVVSLYYYNKMRILKDKLLILTNSLSDDKRKLELSEAELRKAKERAEEASHVKSAFVSNMSHEIRTPLNAIVGFSSLLIESIDATEEQKEYAKIIQKNSDLLLQLISDVLDVSRLESGRLQFNYEWCDLVSCCEGMITLTNQSKTNDVEIHSKFPTESYMLYTDPLRLQQVVVNLLNNALKFTPDGGKITLAFEIDERNSNVLFSVTDTGCGIPEDKQELVFTRFEKLNEFVQGTGLGLAICKLTVQHMGGKIWIDKEYKDGARFIFSHPITKETI